MTDRLCELGPVAPYDRAWVFSDDVTTGIDRVAFTDAANDLCEVCTMTNGQVFVACCGGSPGYSGLELTRDQAAQLADVLSRFACVGRLHY